MDHMPLPSLLLYSLPESIILFTYGFVLFRKRLNKSSIIFASIISVISSYFVRALPIPFGIHSLIGLLIVVILFIMICKFRVKQGVIAAIAGIATVLALENITLYLVQVVTGWSVADILGKGALVRSLLGYPHLITWALLTYFIYRKKYTLVGGDNLFDGDEK